MGRYKAIITNKGIYQEIELTSDIREIILGTEKGCDVRLNRELFFDAFEIAFKNNNDEWVIFCDEASTITTDGIIKLSTKKLEHGDAIVLKNRQTNREILTLSFVIDSGYENQDYEKVIDLTEAEEITIGGKQNNTIYLGDDIVEDEEILLEKRGGKIQLTAIKTKYGIYVNGNRVEGTITISDHNFFSIVGYSFYYKYGKLYTSKNTAISVNGLPCTLEAESTSRFDYPKFNRSTRIQYNVNPEELPLLEPPAAPAKPEQNFILSLLPTIATMFVTVFLRGQMGGGGSYILISAITMGIGIVTSIFSFVGQKKKYKQESVKRIEDYTKYIDEKRNYINEKRNNERAALEEVYYSPKREVDMVQSFSPDLFNRTPFDRDYLHLNIGTGAVPSMQPLAYKEQEKFDVEDELVELPAQLAQETVLLTKAPIVVDCANNGAIGIVGIRRRLHEFMKNALLDFSVRQYYADIKLFFLVSEENANKLEWVRFLPHLQNETLDMRNIVCDDESKNILFEYLYKELSIREELEIKYPNIVVFVYDDMGIKSHPISDYILKAKD